ncbi:MAG: 5' nucleotidase, NT5C type [Calditrichia bacterium]
MADKKRLLIDVDGVLRDFIGSLTQVYKREHPGHVVGEVDSRRLEDFYPIGKAIYSFMDEQFAGEILRDAPALKGAADSMRRWEAKFELCIATNQPPAGRFPTLEWLGKHHIACNTVYIKRDKYLLDGYALLDDFVDNLTAFEATGRLAVCLDQPWNQHWDGPRVSDVDSFFAYVTEQLRLEEAASDGPMFA